MVLESTPFISITACQIFGRNDAELEPSSMPLKLLGVVDIGAGIEAEDAVWRLLVIRGDDPDRRTGAARGDQARHVDEADFRPAGHHRTDRVGRALRRQDGDVQPLVFEIALAERDIPRCVAAEA